MSTYINMNVVFEDEKGKFYFNKTDEKNQVIAKVTPENMGFTKQIKKTIYIAKKISNAESITDETVVFSQEVVFEVPSEKQYATAFLFQTRSKRIMLKWFNSGCTSEIGINDKEFVNRDSKAVRLPNDTLLPKSQRLFTCLTRKLSN